MKIKIFTTGGTIDKVYFDDLSQYEVGEPRVREILETAKANVTYTITEICRKDSIHLTDEDREKIREKIAADKSSLILITHGTDSMSLTAKVLEGDSDDKVIVLTGAMNPYLFKQSDASFNVGCALGALQSLEPGVYIAMSGRIFKASEARKNRDKKQFEKVEWLYRWWIWSIESHLDIGAYKITFCEESE